MGTLYRPKVVEYRTADGKARLPTGERVTKDTLGAVRSETQSKCWWGRWRDANGDRQQKRLSPAKDIARRMLRALEGRAELGGVGIADEGAFEEHYARPLEEHLLDFAEVLRDDDDCEKHVRYTLHCLRELFKGCGATDLRGVACLEEGEVSSWLAKQRRGTGAVLAAGQDSFTCAETVQLVGCNAQVLSRVMRRLGLEGTGKGKARRLPRTTVEALLEHFQKGMSARTSNFYLGTAKHFTSWLCRRKNRRIPEDPLRDLERMDEDADQRVRRRTLSLDDFRKLLAATRTGPKRKGLTGEQRWLLYQLAARTGLRASEVRSLTPASVDLDALLVTARAAYTKNRQEANQPVREDLAGLLRQYQEGRDRRQPLFPGDWFLDAADVLRADLEAARIPYMNEQGEQYDFHALRAQYITDLVRAGNNPSDVQRLARHSTITLTMQTYTKVRITDLRAAVDRLPSFSDEEQESETPNEASAAGKAPRSNRRRLA